MLQSLYNKYQNWKQKRKQKCFDNLAYSVYNAVTKAKSSDTSPPEAIELLQKAKQKIEKSEFYGDNIEEKYDVFNPDSLPYSIFSNILQRIDRKPNLKMPDARKVLDEILDCNTEKEQVPDGEEVAYVDEYDTTIAQELEQLGFSRDKVYSEFAGYAADCLSILIDKIALSMIESGKNHEINPDLINRAHGAILKIEEIINDFPEQKAIKLEHEDYQKFCQVACIYTNLMYRVILENEKPTILASNHYGGLLESISKEMQFFMDKIIDPKFKQEKQSELEKLTNKYAQIFENTINDIKQEAQSQYNNVRELAQYAFPGFDDNLNIYLGFLSANSKVLGLDLDEIKEQEKNLILLHEKKSLELSNNPVYQALKDFEDFLCANQEFPELARNKSIDNLIDLYRNVSRNVLEHAETNRFSRAHKELFYKKLDTIAKYINNFFNLNQPLMRKNQELILETARALAKQADLDFEDSLGNFVRFSKEYSYILKREPKEKLNYDLETSKTAAENTQAYISENVRAISKLYDNLVPDDDLEQENENYSSKLLFNPTTFSM